MDADPQFALAHVALAETLLNGLSLNRAPLEDVTAEVEPLINHALAISPNLPDALAAQGWLYTEQYKLDEALGLLQRAIAGNPNDAASLRFLGNLYDRRGAAQRGADQLLRRRQPRSAGFHFAGVPLPGAHRPRRLQGSR